MLDGLSLIASAITIIEAVSQAIKYAKAFYRASTEFEVLQNQVDEFAKILQEIEGQQQILSPTVVTSLSRARDILDQLDKLVKGKVLSEVNGSSHIRRRAWAKYRTKVYEIQHSLADHKANLMIAILANGSPSAARSEAILISISHEVGVLRSILHSISAFSGSSMYPTPATPLETSHHFFPETYTLESEVPRSCLVVLAAYEQFSRADAKTNVYKLLYLNSPRRWRWLTLCIEIPCSSRYWTVTRITQGEYRKWQTPNGAGAALLPQSLERKIQDLLCRSGDTGDDTRLRLSLSDEDTIQQNSRIATNDATLTIPISSAPSLDALNYLHDLGCARYVEEQVTQIELVELPNRFVSSINGTLVYEVKNKDSTPGIEFLYNIQVLHCMEGVPGFAKLIGIVTDNGGKQLKSYLIEFPKARWNIIQLAVKPSITWERRERWAIQLIQGISQIHKKGFVVGGLTLFSFPAIIDITDSVHFWSFKKKLVPGRSIGAYYPPELCHVRNMSPTTSEADIPHVTPKTDIFHLGLLLWLMAENKPITRASPVCMREGCDTLKAGCCDLSHAEPVALPQLPENVPLYYRKIVKLCRAAKPSDRPAAREVLGMFPNGSNVPEQPMLRELYSSDMGTLGDALRVGKLTCSICSERHLPLPVFHCNVCDLGDFDLCQACFEGGAHCDDDDHLLVELGNIGHRAVARRYHSCVKSLGIRNVIDL